VIANEDKIKRMLSATDIVSKEALAVSILKANLNVTQVEASTNC
jgi:hypothetical protein